MHQNGALRGADLIVQVGGGVVFWGVVSCVFCLCFCLCLVLVVSLFWLLVVVLSSLLSSLLLFVIIINTVFSSLSSLLFTRYLHIIDCHHYYYEQASDAADRVRWLIKLRDVTSITTTSTTTASATTLGV